ncbi:dolichyl-diphosphooligosaccharide--protein glycosyltransferase subunit 1 [Tilletia horrida]|nr:dolichyl-diphosphooligosaccharide--protein glycosyltransferase subunit 1 [Tilletia horrida]
MRRTMLLSVLSALGLLAFSASASQLPQAGDWTNENYDRIIDLGGSVTRSVTRFAIKANSSLTESSAGDTVPYYISLSPQEDIQLAWNKLTLAVEQSASDQPPLILDLERASRPNSTHHVYPVQVPKSSISEAAASSKALLLTLEATFTHSTVPLPKQVAQNDPLFLEWEGEVGVRSPYPTEQGKVKVRSQHPRILSYAPTEPSDLVSKSGSTLTFGVHKNIAPIALDGKADASTLTSGRVHYQYDQPVISAVEFNRHVEVSHWGNNLATEDKIWLRNDGASLKGFFSRVEHQKATYQSKLTSHILQVITLHLPPGAKDAYYIDRVGNVSTSHFNRSPNAPQLVSAPGLATMQGKTSRLSVQPRYPLLGGWNYSFSVGWNSDLGEGGWGRSVPAEGLQMVAKDLKGAEGGKDRYVVGVLFSTAITDVALDKVQTRVVLPEGAVITQVDTPFELDSIKHETYFTYLDTIGRPAVVLEKTRASEQNSQLIYIHYTLSKSAHYRKPLAISAIVFSFFAVLSTLRRFDTKISS